MGKRRPKPVSILTDAEWRPPLIETEGIAGKTIIMSNHNFYPNTELDIDLKLLTRKPGRLGIGEYLVQRNPHVYEGTYINVNRKNDGTLYPTFNRPQFTEKFTFQNFCLLAAKELCAISGLG